MIFSNVQTIYFRFLNFWTLLMWIFWDNPTESESKKHWFDDFSAFHHLPPWHDSVHTILSDDSFFAPPHALVFQTSPTGNFVDTFYNWTLSLINNNYCHKWSSIVQLDRFRTLCNPIQSRCLIDPPHQSSKVCKHRNIITSELKRFKNGSKWKICTMSIWSRPKVMKSTFVTLGFGRVVSEDPRQQSSKVEKSKIYGLNIIKNRKI